MEWLPLVGMGGGVAKFAHDAWKAGQPPIKPADPLIVAVHDSVTVGGQHVLTLECRNLGAHGVYLESMTLNTPTVQPVVATVIEERSMSYADPTTRSLPLLLPGGESVRLRVEVAAFPAARLAKKPFGKLDLKFTVVGVAESDSPREIEFAVRV